MWSRSFTVILLLVAFGESQTQYHFGPSRNAGSKVFPGGEVAKGHTQFNRSTFNIEKKTYNFSSSGHGQYGSFKSVNSHPKRDPIHDGWHGGPYSNNKYTVEIALVVDQLMNDRYANDIQDYLLLLMSSTSNLFAKSNFGYTIKLSVSSILYLHKEIPATPIYSGAHVIGKDGIEMLTNFCKYMQSSTEVKYDATVFLTGHKLYMNDANPIRIGGLGNVGHMCQRSACAIVEDAYLSGAFSIAHELGHVFGGMHDDDAQCSGFANRTGCLMGNGRRWQWSPCSIDKITKFVRTKGSNCLVNKPTVDLLSFLTMNEKLLEPGKQCRVWLGPEARAYNPINCMEMWCVNGKNITAVVDTPWADGTKCDNNKWCQQGKCVVKKSNSKKLQSNAIQHNVGTASAARNYMGTPDIILANLLIMLVCIIYSQN